MINLLMKFKNNVHIMFVFTILYFAFGVWSPVRMAYLNNAIMSYVYVGMAFISDLFILSALAVRSYL